MAKNAPASSGVSAGAKGILSTKVMLAAAAVVIVALGATLIWTLFFRDTPAEEPEERGTMRGVVVNQDNVDRVVDEMATMEPVRGGNFITSMTTEWHFPDGQSPAEDSFVENVEANGYDIYFDVLLEDTEEVIYASPVLPRGTFIQNFSLDQDLDAGTYPCVIVYHMVDDEQNTLGTLRIQITVVVEG